MGKEIRSSPLSWIQNWGQPRALVGAPCSLCSSPALWVISVCPGRIYLLSNPFPHPKQLRLPAQRLHSPSRRGCDICKALFMEFNHFLPVPVFSIFWASGNPFPLVSPCPPFCRRFFSPRKCNFVSASLSSRPDYFRRYFFFEPAFPSANFLFLPLSSQFHDDTACSLHLFPA